MRHPLELLQPGLNVPLELLQNPDISPSTKLVASALRLDPGMTIQEVAMLTGLSERTVIRCKKEIPTPFRAKSPAKPPENGPTTGNNNDREDDNLSPKMEANSRGTRLDPDWGPDRQTEAWARGEGFTDAEVSAQLAQFIDYWVSKPGAGGRKTDWERTFKNWLRRSREFSAKRPARGGSPIWGGIRDSYRS